MKVATLLTVTLYSPVWDGVSNSTELYSSLVEGESPEFQIGGKD